MNTVKGWEQELTDKYLIPVVVVNGVLEQIDFSMMKGCFADNFVIGRGCDRSLEGFNDSCRCGKGGG